MPCEMFLAATGIRPNIDLVREAGIPVNKGVLVDDRMQTPRNHKTLGAAERAELRSRNWSVLADPTC